jgi:hypothetical protein
VEKALWRAACRGARDRNQEATSGGERASRGAAAARQGKALEGGTPGAQAARNKAATARGGVTRWEVEKT